MNEQPDYNLMEEPWLPVLLTDGMVKRVGILETLQEAGRIRSIAATNPMDRFAAFRFLLALLYWCQGNPPDPMPDKGFPSEWFQKLREHRDCFNLLGDGKRLYQTAAAKRERPVTDLIQEVPTGNNFSHFTHSNDQRDALCLSCCALGLLRLPLFSVSGLPDLKSGINGSPPVYIYSAGTTLFTTLLLNWTTVRAIGTPSWERTSVTLKPGESIPLLDGFTLPSRRVWLHQHATSDGPCIACGTREGTFLRTCELQSAGSQETSLWRDPHVLYYSNGKFNLSHRAGNPKDSGKFRTDRPWNDLLLRMFYSESAGDYAGQTLHIVGFSSNKADNVDVWERVLPISSVSDNVQELLEQWKTSSSDSAFSYRFLTADERSRRRSSAGAVTYTAAMKPHIETLISSQADFLLAGGAEAWQKAAETWDPLLEAAARSLAPGFTTAALMKQKRIRSARPVIKPPRDEAADNTEL